MRLKSIIFKPDTLPYIFDPMLSFDLLLLLLLLLLLVLLILSTILLFASTAILFVVKVSCS